MNFGYIYNYLDHLGNVRLSYTYNSKMGLQIIEESNYYPFGLKHEGYNEIGLQNPNYNYKYNGKELQETGMYDYGARMYMPDIGRWGVVDPLAETSRRWSTYTYAYNNPIRFIDPDGMEGEDTVQKVDVGYGREVDISKFSGSVTYSGSTIEKRNPDEKSKGKASQEGNQQTVFVNGKLGGGSPEGGKAYWNTNFVKKALEVTGSNSSYFINSDYDYLSSANDRFSQGYNEVLSGGLVTSKLNKDTDKLVFVTHSMGAAYAEGMIAGLQEQGWTVAAAYHFNAFQAKDIVSHAPITVDFQTRLDPVINNPIRSSPGSIKNSINITKYYSNTNYFEKHRAPIDDAKTWGIIKNKLNK